MKFGVTLPNFGKYADKEEIVRIALTSEELGFDSIWVSDHVVIPETHKGFGDVFYEPFVTLSYLAAETKTINLGTSVIILPYRNPVVLAKMISTLDNLSDGRIILGLGAGWLKDEFDALGVPYELRGEMMDEFLDILKILWTQENPSFKGKHFNFSDIQFLPQPIQKPFPPIWIGGSSRKAMERAVERGNAWHPVGLTPQELENRLSPLRQLSDNQQKKTFRITLRRNIEITEKNIEEGETLRGSIEKIIRGLKEYRKIGVDYMLLHFLSGSSQGVIKSMKIFSEDIRPRISN